MAQTVADVMTGSPIVLRAQSPVMDAAQAMRDGDMGDVIVVQGDDLCGIVTDRDIVVRAVAEGRDLSRTRLDEICSRDVTSVPSTAPVEDAVRLMRQKAIRRLPVVDRGSPVGVVSLGDLAIERDRDSALGDISAAHPNT